MQDLTPCAWALSACLGMKNIGKPCAGKPHARFDEGGQAKACSLLYPLICEVGNGRTDRGLCFPDAAYRRTESTGLRCQNENFQLVKRIVHQAPQRHRKCRWMFILSDGLFS